MGIQDSQQEYFYNIMSGLGKLGGLPGFVAAGDLVSQKDIDQYYITNVDNPSVSATFFGTATGTTSGTVALLNAIGDWPRNPQYVLTGIASGTYGGTVTANWIDQFGVPVQENVVIGSAVNGGTTYGTVIAAKFVSASLGTNVSSGTFIGTLSIGYGTVSNGSANSNWFGLLSKIAGTGDVSNIRWSNNGTVTGLNKGTNIGTLVNATSHAFQGTAGVAITDTYTVISTPSFDNTSFGTMCAL